MARTALTPITVSLSNAVDLASESEAANADGEKFYNSGKTLLYVANANAVTRTVTVQTPRTVDGLAVAEHTQEVAQDETMVIGPFPRDTFNQTSGDDAGMVYVDFDAVTDLTVAAIEY